MHPSSILVAPKPRTIIRFWLTAIGLGTILVLLYELFNAREFAEVLVIPMAIGIFTVIASTLSLPLLLLLLPWALESPSFIQRRFRLLAVQSISAGATYWLVYSIIKDPQYARALPKIGVGYILAGLGTAYWRYLPWLTRPV